MTYGTLASSAATEAAQRDPESPAEEQAADETEQAMALEEIAAELILQGENNKPSQDFSLAVCSVLDCDGISDRVASGISD